MSDVQPLLDIVPHCPTCGAPLKVEVLGPEPSGDDRVLCERCGDLGGRNEVSRQVVDRHGDQIREAARDHIRDQLRKALGGG